MSFLKSIFSKKEILISSSQDFWNWFKQNEAQFFNVVSQKDRAKIERDFFDKLTPKLKELKDGFFFLTGMPSIDKAELVLTADGAIKNIAFVEELVAAAPEIKNWVITALKPPSDIKNVSIQMAGYNFTADNLFFYADDVEGYPDEINVNIVYSDFKEADKKNIFIGTNIFLDNFLGELNFATTVDNLNVIGKESAEKELIPIEKLKAYLIWREKEFVEKYEGVRCDTENGNYSSFEAELENGNFALAIINMDLLDWDGKASHPWISLIELKYDGSKTNGMPDSVTYKLLDDIENDIIAQLKDHDGYLNIGRETADGDRTIYFACKDFRKPSKVLHAVKQKYSGKLIAFDYDIYKDKYWQSLDRFVN